MYIEREIKNRFSKVQKVYNAFAIVGPRQSGKTTFLKEQAKSLNSSYVVFDDPDSRNLFEEDIKKFEKQYIEGYDLSILDEMHYCKDAGPKLKYLIDRDKKLWITSSSEILLSKDILSYLVGRVSIIKLYPFSLAEFLIAKGIRQTTKESLQRSIWEHLNYGGYPKVTLISDFETKKIILKDLYDTMILKDIARVFSIQDIRSLEDFTRHIAINIGGIISYESISKDLKTSFQTIKKYIDAMEKSYLIIRVIPFYTNKTKELIKQPKFYFMDTGLRNVITNDFNTDVKGNVFENYVLCELIKLGFSPKYWRTKSKLEVDFIIEKDSQIIPIEVKLNAKIDKIEKNLASFIDIYKPKKAIVVTYRTEMASINIHGCKVYFIAVNDLNKILML